ncbi:hypothetical protein [Brachybacterium kimchii]|uniref:Uncharacterized protein n=1 Tax=Brachybacterium kimchii TaxID=2942909 RepID=A0ABY4ND01_9MICO|nr:hypothetical protein [Brachybacterium kimchii]UQN31781.1 hypothetical protein M4486_19520 [Brachybacterium kimchii]
MHPTIDLHVARNRHLRARQRPERPWGAALWSEGAVIADPAAPGFLTWRPLLGAGLVIRGHSLIGLLFGLMAGGPISWLLEDLTSWDHPAAIAYLGGSLLGLLVSDCLLAPALRRRHRRMTGLPRSAPLVTVVSFAECSRRVRDLIDDLEILTDEVWLPEKITDEHYRHLVVQILEAAALDRFPAGVWLQIAAQKELDAALSRPADHRHFVPTPASSEEA